MEMTASVALASDKAGKRVLGPTTDRPGVSRRIGVGEGSRSCDEAATARGGSGGTSVVAPKQRRCEVGCFLARAADPAGEGNKSDAEAWRRRTNLKEAQTALIVRLPSWRVNV